MIGEVAARGGRVSTGRSCEPVAAAYDRGLLAGAVTLVWERGSEPTVNAIGMRDLEARLPMARDTVFQIASMTKPIVVAAALSLVDDGRLVLADRIDRWLPEFAEPRVLVDPHGPSDRTVRVQRPLTVEDLMTHRSGIGYRFTVSGPIAQQYQQLPYEAGLDAWLAELARLPLVYQPGEHLLYGYGIDVLGAVLSRIEGKPLPQVVDERVLSPLQMVDTGFYVRPGAVRRAAATYRFDRAGALHRDTTRPAPGELPPFLSGGGGLWSTVDDYLRFVQMLLDDGVSDGVRVLSAESVRAMRTDRLTAAEKRQKFLGRQFYSGCGFGLNLLVVTDPVRSMDSFGPGGLGTFTWSGAYGTLWQADPAAGLVIIYMVQNNVPRPDDSTPSAVPAALLEAARAEFVRRTYAAVSARHSRSM